MKVLGYVLLTLLACGIAAFFLTTHFLALQHGNTMIEEWQTWFGIVKDSKDVVETAKIVFIKS